MTNTRYNEQDYKLGIGFSNDKISSTLRYNFNKLDLGINEEGIATQTNIRTPEYPRQQVFNHIVSLHNHLFFKNSKLDANFGYLFNDRSEFEDSNIPSLQMHLKTVNYDIKYFLPKIKKVEAIFGVQGMYQTNTNKAEELLIPDATINDFGIFTTANYEWKTNVIQAGIRMDNRKINTKEHGIATNLDYVNAINKTFTSFNASLGYKTEPFKKTTMRLNVATGFRAPNLAELTSNGVHEGTNRYEIGNANLKNEQNVQIDFALAYKNKHVEVFANSFYNGINKYIFLAPNGTEIDGNTVFSYIQDNANLYGGEFGFDLHPHPLDWLHIQSSFETVIAKKNNGGSLPLIPANKINTSLKSNFEIPKLLQDVYFTITMENVFKQNKVSVFETKSNAYNLMHLGFGGAFKSKKNTISLSINVNNIFDTAYLSHLSRLKVDNIPNAGRNVAFGLNFRF